MRATGGAAATARAPSSRPAATIGGPHAALFLALFGAIVLVQVAFLVTSQRDLLARHRHEGDGAARIAGRTALFGERSGGGGASAASLASSLLEAFRANQADSGVYVDGAGFVPVAAALLSKQVRKAAAAPALPSSSGTQSPAPAPATPDASASGSSPPVVRAQAW